MAETFVNWGVRHVFGMVGSSNLGVADAFRRLAGDGRLEYIGVRHEGAASFAASAYAKLTGRPAACFAIAGPGATNLLTGLWDAKSDRAPVLALTGQVASQVMGPGAFQEIDLASAFEAVSRWSQTVHADSNHVELANLAMRNAILERDVAHLIFPDEVQTIPVGEGVRAGGPDGRLPNLEIEPSEAVLADALTQLRRAKRPAIIVGYGARHDMAAVVRLAELCDAPIITTFKAKGQVADAHPLAAGVLGHSGTPVASWLMNEADLLVVLGASFSNHSGIAQKATIQVDRDPLQLGRVQAVSTPILGSIGVTIDRLCDTLGATEAVDQRPDIEARRALWEREMRSRAADDRGGGVSSAAIFESLTRLAPSDAVLSVDVGNNTYAFGRYFQCSGDQPVVMSGYLGSIGFAYPAAIGTQVAAPDRMSIAVAGDGGFAQYMGELTTAVKHELPIKLLVLNNGELGKITKEQQAEMFDVWATSLHNPNFARYAENCGALGVRVEASAHLDAAFEAAFAHDGPAVVEVMADPLLL
jgi:thiamine pyrophosphate-dependent acetolactate synthase large subunit-like protein